MSLDKTPRDYLVRKLEEFDAIPVRLPANTIEIEGWHRPANEDWVIAIAASFDWTRFPRLLVRITLDGHYLLIDGLHRMEAAKQVYGNDIEFDALAFYDMPETEAAKLWTTISTPSGVTVT